MHFYFFIIGRAGIRTSHFQIHKIITAEKIAYLWILPSVKQESGNWKIVMQMNKSI